MNNVFFSFNVCVSLVRGNFTVDMDIGLFLYELVTIIVNDCIVLYCILFKSLDIFMTVLDIKYSFVTDS